MATTPEPAAPAKTAVAAPQQFSPVAVHFPVKSRANATAQLQSLAPAGKPDPILLEIAKATALALIEKKFPNATGLGITIEINAGNAAQIMVIVFPHDL